MKVKVKFTKAINRSHWSWSLLAKLKKPLEGEVKNKFYVCFMLRKCFASSDGFVCFTNRQGMLSSTDMSECFLKLRFLRIFVMLNSFSRAINHSPRSRLTKKEIKTSSKDFLLMHHKQERNNKNVFKTFFLFSRLARARFRLEV